MISNFSEGAEQIWEKYFGKKFVIFELAVIWIFPTLIWIAAWVENVEFATGTGNEDGRVCYAVQQGKRVFLTKLQLPLLLFFEMLV